MENIEIKLTEVDARSKSNTKRIDKMETRLDETDKIVTAIATLNTRMGGVEGDVSEIKADVKELTGKPGKRWDNIVDKLLWLLIGGAVAYLILSISGGTVQL